MNITRHQLLVGGLGITAVAGLAVFGFGRTAIESEIVSGIRKRLSFLQLDEVGLRKFASDQVGSILSKRPTIARWKYHIFSNFSPSMMPSFARYLRTSDHRTRLERTIDQFSSTYLLSSDYFINGCDDSELVLYMAFYDPMRACGNPFAKFNEFKNPDDKMKITKG
jgi:hypothetical protein